MSHASSPLPFTCTVCAAAGRLCRPSRGYAVLVLFCLGFPGCPTFKPSPAHSLIFKALGVPSCPPPLLPTLFMPVCACARGWGQSGRWNLVPVRGFWEFSPEQAPLCGPSLSCFQGNTPPMDHLLAPPCSSCASLSLIVWIVTSSMPFPGPVERVTHRTSSGTLIRKNVGQKVPVCLSLFSVGKTQLY